MPERALHLRRRGRHVGRRVRQRHAAVEDRRKLVAAFDHRHIFIDPDPDPAKPPGTSASACSICRARRGPITTPRLISKGGGVFPRTAKTIALADEMKALTGVDEATRVTPVEMIRALLTAEVDLLFFGGIGTFIKSASAEQSPMPATAPTTRVRVNGKDVRAKVIGEGANLGLTQPGRIEYAREGRAHQHRRHRQFGGRRHLGPRGQSQDPDERTVAPRRDHQGRARRDAGRDDRRRGARSCSRTITTRPRRSRWRKSRAARDLDASGRFMRALEARGHARPRGRTACPTTKRCARAPAKTAA